MYAVFVTEEDFAAINKYLASLCDLYSFHLDALSEVGLGRLAAADANEQTFIFIIISCGVMSIVTQSYFMVMH